MLTPTRPPSITVILLLIPLLIVNLQYLAFLVISYGKPSFINSFSASLPFLSVILSIDLAAISFSPPARRHWNLYTLGPLLFLNIFFHLDLLIISIGSPYSSLILFGYLPYYTSLLIVDIIVCVVRLHPYRERAWIVSQIVLATITTALAILTYLYFH
jgi:hypothetical protein